MTEKTLVDPIKLIEVIEGQLKKVNTQSLDLSFNELLDMKKNKELNINPEYQRLFRWSEGSRSRFVESLLLEMPVPPIYVIEENDGKYILIDGLQRISSYLHLRGELEATHLDPPVNLGDFLVLSECDIVKELNGFTYNELSTALQIKLKRAFIRVEVVRKGSDPKFKYHMFKRLNTGGNILSPQQMRNCTIRLLDSRFNDFIIELSKTEEFNICTDSLTQEQILSAFDQELVLRFFALKNNIEDFSHDVTDFLTEYMETISDPDNKVAFDYNKEREIFIKTFGILAKVLNDKAFGIANKKRDSITKGFGVYQYEALTIGLQPYLDKIDMTNDSMCEMLQKELTNIKLNSDFINITTGGGKNSKGPLRDRIKFVVTHLSNFI